MEYCRVCGQPIEKKLFKVNINGVEYEDVCQSCSVCIYNIAHSDMVSKETVKFCEKKLRKIYDEGQASEEVKSWIKVLLDAERVEADDIKVNPDGMQYLQIEKPEQSTSEGEIRGKTFWSSKVKAISICELILSIIFGCIIAYSLDDDFVVLGALIGGVAGAITYVINMFIVEVAENIASCVNLLSKIASEE